MITLVQQRGIDMVLRFNGSPVDPEQINSVREFINRPVISYRSDLDITKPILEDLNRAGARAAPVAPPR
jgi:hypothetical protein